MAEPRALVDFDLSVPETWASIPPVPDDSGWEREVAEELCDGQYNRAVLEYRLQCTHPDLMVERHNGLGVWVPSRNLPDIGGFLVIDARLGDEGHELRREEYRSLIDPDQRDWCTVFSRHIEEVELPAGPALVVREVLSQNQAPGSEEDEVVEEHTIYTVFPPGCTDALELMFWTPSLELGDEMAADAAATMETVSVALGDRGGE